MADLYPPNSYPIRQQQPYHRPQDSNQQYPINNDLVYPPTLISSSSTSTNGSDQNFDSPQSAQKSPDQSQPQQQSQQPAQPKTESATGGGKPQATFLTKLYALLERPENHHMIRWDPTGEHIIVEKPEQLALHVLPSVYRQSRFASFSRQLNIYGFMRKVNLRNVDPAIDDPDASTWSHPTLNRHSPAEVVANFKRRVPPRLPKPKKRDTDPASLQQGSRSATGLGPHGGNPVPFQVPSSYGAKPISNSGRQRGFSAPGSFTPLSQGGAAAAGWGSSYPHPGGMRGALPPLTVPSDPPSAMGHGGMYTHSPGGYPLNSPGEEPGYGGAPTHNGLPGLSPYSSSGPGGGGSQYPYTQSEPPQQSSWGMGGSAGSNAGGASSHSGSLSSLLNPSSGSGYSSSGYHHPSSSHAHSSHQRPTINTSYSSPYSSMPTTASSIPSPDSRPNTGYSVSSMSSMPPYEDGYGSRPGSSAHRPLSPGSRPPSAHSKSYHNGTGSLRVAPTKGSRRHSQAMSPYPSPYDHHHGPNDSRPSTSPHPPDDHHHSGSAMPRVRSMIQLPSVDSYSFNPSQGDFAYSAGGGDSAMDTTPPHHQPQHPHSSHGWAPSGEHEAYGRQLRPSTSASSVSASSAATPPGTGHGEGGYGQADVNRYSPDFGFVPMNEHLPQYVKSAGDL